MTLHGSTSSVSCRLAISTRLRAYSQKRHVKIVRPGLIHKNRARPRPSHIDVLIAPLTFAPLLGRNRKMEIYQHLAKADIDLRRAHSRLQDLVRLATRFTTPAIRRKGETVAALYRRALTEAWSSPVREAHWRRFIIAAASLSRDLDTSARPAPNDAMRRAHDAIARIVDENADLLDDGVPSSGGLPQ
jgi:hypothetical protein